VLKDLPYFSTFVVFVACLLQEQKMAISITGRNFIQYLIINC
jgi:hypothetical protein